MIPFELSEPRTLREAATLLGGEDPAARAIAGGTAVMLMMKMGVLRPTRLVSLRAIERRYSGLDVEAGGTLRIGAMATLSALERSPLVKKHAPVITRTLGSLSNVRVRNVATLGGHLAHGDPHMDLPPVLIALNAQVVTMSGQGERTLPLAQLYKGYLETTLGRGELIAEIGIPPQGSWRTAYLKCTARSADDWPALGVAVSVNAVPGREGAGVSEARVVVGAATDTPVRLAAAERALCGARVDDAALRRAGDAAAAEARVVSDQHGSAAYKQELVRVYVARAARAALQMT